jgi:hypothetical protein
MSARGALVMGLLHGAMNSKTMPRAATLVVRPEFLFRLFLEKTVDVSMVREFLPINDHTIQLRPLKLHGFYIHGLNSPTFDLVVNGELICHATLLDKDGEVLGAL